MANAQKFRDQDNTDDQPEVVEIDGAAGKRLKSFIERIERLEEEKAGLAEDIRKFTVKPRPLGLTPKSCANYPSAQMEENKRAEEDMLIETYKSAIGMV
jgi:uncharacterized protein (UPF0335 family)